MIRGVERLLFIVLTVLIVLTSAAYADSFRLRLEDLGAGRGIVITDNAVGDWNPLAGMITYLGSLNGSDVNVTTGISKPVIGGINNYAELDLNSVNIKFFGAGTIRITLEDAGYTSGPDGALSMVGLVGGTMTSAPGSTANFQSWVNPSNSVPVLGPDAPSPSMLSAIGAMPPAGSVGMWSEGGVTFGPGAFSSTASNGFIHSGAYSLFTQATIHFTGRGDVSFDSNLSPVPEPASLLLLGSGLAGLALWGCMKRKSTQI